MRFIAAVAPLSTFTATHRREGGVHKILQTAIIVMFAWSVPAAAEQDILEMIAQTYAVASIRDSTG